MYMRLLIALFVIATLGGCVTSKTFEAKEAELAAARDAINASETQAKANLDAATATREELKACQTQAQTDQAAALETRARLEHELINTQRDLEQCNKITESARRYSETLKAREENLREKLNTEVTAKEVEISRLRDQLSVRVVDSILFKSGRADILPAGKKVLDKLVDVLASTDDMIRVEGHTDSVPIGERLKQRYDSNWELSAARASSVVRYFEIGLKIEPTRLEAVGFSKFRPVAAGNLPEDLQRNRRVEIVLTAPRMPEAVVETVQPPASAP